MKEDKEFENMDNIKIGKLIAKRRKKKGLTQSQLAEHLGVSNKTISTWETSGGLPDISLLIDLADALNISIDNLLKGIDAQEDTFDFEHSVIIKKKYYRQFLCDQYFTNPMYWIIDVFTLLLILVGIAVLHLKIYFSNYFAILAKICILLGIIVLLIPLFIILYKVGTYHPLEVFYVFKEDRIVYLNNGEEMTYDFH